jgi:putative CocE/NonD family hydrolase
LLLRRAATGLLCLVIWSIAPCLSAPVQLPAQSVAVSASQFEALSGEYTDPGDPDMPISVYVENGKLIAESERNIPVTLKPLSPLEFAIPDSPITLRFTLDAAGRGSTAAYSSTPNNFLNRTGEAVHHLFHDYQRTEVMIPMRDGVKLHAVILKPADIATPLPFLMERTPYGVNGTDRGSIFAQRPELARAGYIFVAEDIRGRYKSEGKFIMMHPLADHSNPKSTDESTDAYDTIAWLLKNIPGNNGRVGVVGTSYPGFLTMMAGIDPHPAVKAISPQAPMIDVWLGDDFFHNGAFRQGYGFDYVEGMESSKEFTTNNFGKDKSGSTIDGFDYFLQRGSFEQDVKQSRSPMLPTWKLILDHPAYDSTWSSRSVLPHLDKVAVPTLSVGGYYDQEDMFGPQQEYATLEPHDTEHDNFLALGPWRHGSWNQSLRHLGNLEYGEPIGKEFRARIEAKFFGHYLKDEPNFDLADTSSFQSGSNTWKQYSHFPPPESQSTALHLTGKGMMSWTASTTASRTSYVSDPAQPVPYRHRPIQPTYGTGSQWYNWLLEDQSFVTKRIDVAVWKLPALTQDLTVTGEVVADIFAATTGSDNDLVVKLIDQYPEDDPDPAMRGYQLMTNAEIFRGRYLSSFTNPQALQPGSIREYKFSLHDIDHVFKKGHTVMVEIQSSWFPLYDRNPQTFVPNIMKAKPADYKPATIVIYSGPGHDSSLQLPIVGAMASQ